jgi:hypothetical protein
MILFKATILETDSDMYFELQSVPNIVSKNKTIYVCVRARVFAWVCVCVPEWEAGWELLSRQ